MKKEIVGNVCVSTTPSSLYVVYPKTTVPSTYSRAVQVPYFSYYYYELLAIVVRSIYSTVLYILARTSKSVEIN